MGLTKTQVTARISEENMQHVLSMCLSQFPNLSVSAAIDCIVSEHRQVYESGQQILCRRDRLLQVIETLLGETGEGKQKFCTREKTA